MPTNLMSQKGSHRGVGGGDAAPARRERRASAFRVEAGPGVQVSLPGQPAVQRGHRPDGGQGPLERAAGRPRTSSSSKHIQLSGAGRVVAGALPRRVPEPGGAYNALKAARGSGGHPADGACPPGIVPGFQHPLPAPRSPIKLRLNVAIPPTPSWRQRARVIAGDAAGFSNGRRVFDDVVTIELVGHRRAHVPAGFNPSYTSPTRRLNAHHRSARRLPAPAIRSQFLHLGTPVSGFATKPLAA